MLLSKLLLLAVANGTASCVAKGSCLTAEDGKKGEEECGNVVVADGGDVVMGHGGRKAREGGRVEMIDFVFMSKSGAENLFELSLECKNEDGGSPLVVV